jgi:hypothetical protein
MIVEYFLAGQPFPFSVLKPKRLREEFKEMVKGMTAKYLASPL